MGIKLFCYGAFLFLCACNVSAARIEMFHRPPPFLSKPIGHGHYDAIVANPELDSPAMILCLTSDDRENGGCVFFGFDMDKRYDAKVAKLEECFYGFAKMSILTNKERVEGLRFLRFDSSGVQQGMVSNWVSSVAQDFMLNGAFTHDFGVTARRTGDWCAVVAGDALIAEISGVSTTLNSTNGVIYEIWVRRRRRKENPKNACP